MNSTIPADLLALKVRFDHWRDTRSTRSPIPQHLRQAAIALLERHSAAAICRACRLHPHTLKSSTLPTPKPRKPPSTPAPLFFPLPPPNALPLLAAPAPAQTDCRLVLERPDGARLTLAFPQLDAASLATLCADFLRS